MRICLLVSSLFLFSGCFFFYSFQGISIPAEANTFYIATFEENLRGLYTPPPSLYQNFTDALIDKVKNESRLVQDSNDPDIEFKGAFTNYNVTYVAPKAGEEVSFNRLQVSVRIEYKSKFGEGDNKEWNNTFSFFQDFGVDENLLDVQDVLLEQITEQLIEDIFNKAFTNW